MSHPAVEEWDDDELVPWADATRYGPGAPIGEGFWGGVEDHHEDGPLRGWWIRSLRSEAKKYAPAAGAETWDRMVMWLVEAGAPGGYIIHRTDDTYRTSQGGGAWRLNSEPLTRDLPKAFAWAAAAAGATQSLDDVLAAPLAFLKVARPEPAGAALLEKQGAREAATRLHEMKHAVRAHWPRPCVTCGNEFRPARRGGVNCDGCRAKRRAVLQPAGREG